MVLYPPFMCIRMERLADQTLNVTSNGNVSDIQLIVPSNNHSNNNDDDYYRAV